MNGLASVAFGIVTVLGTVTLAASVASIGMAESTEQGLRGQGDTTLWTEQPTRVNPTNQAYERLPPALSTYAVAEIHRVRSRPQVVVAARPVANSLPAPSAISPEHLNWCSSRYRSFDPATNTYRTFQGQVRVCQSPFKDNADVVAYTPPAAAGRLTGEATWCASRYKSYRAEDNTYQPYDGPRVKCTPPAGGQTLASSE